jgi:hypothetical protein
MALYKISSSRVNNIEATEYVGGTNELGLIWYDEVDGILRLYNDQPGGKIINNGSGGTPGGANTQVQFNNNGTFGGSANLTFDPVTGALGTTSVSATGNISAQFFVGNGSLLTGITASLPAQAGNAGKYLSTNGIVPSWQTVAGVFGLTIDGGDADFASADFVIDAGGA